jgi:uncharacterized protein (DUF885 family)
MLASVSMPVLAETATTETAAETDQNAAIMAFFEEHDAEGLARSPLGKSFRGIKDSDYGRWDDGSEEADARAMDAERSALREMKARFDFAKLSPENQLSYRLFEKRFERMEAADKFDDNGYVFDQMNGAQSQIPSFLINIHRIDSKSDARAYISRLYGIGPAMNDAIGQARSRAAKGVMPPKWVFPYVISDARNVITGAPFGDGPDAPLFADFKARIC